MRNASRWIDRVPIIISEDPMEIGWGWHYKQGETIIESTDHGIKAFVPVIALPGSSITGIRLILKNDQVGKGVTVGVYKRAIQSGAITDTLIIGAFNFVNSGETGYFLKTVAPFAAVPLLTDFAYYMQLLSITDSNVTEIASIGIMYEKRML